MRCSNAPVSPCARQNTTQAGSQTALREPAVAHGFRLPRNWAAEVSNHPREVVEKAVARMVWNKVEAAHARSDLVERRGRLNERLGYTPRRGTAHGRRATPQTRRDVAVVGIPRGLAPPGARNED